MKKRDIEEYLTFQAGIDLRSIQELLGHKSVETVVSVFSARHIVSEMNKTKLISPLDF